VQNRSVSQRNVELVASETYAVQVRDGRIVRVEEYRTVQKALEAMDRPQT